MAKELLFSITRKDLLVDFFSGTGKGGQHRNKHMNCVRLRHPESGASVTGQSNKSRAANIKEALDNLVADAKFKLWHNKKVNEVLNKMTLEDIVDEMMSPENIKTEVKKDGKWVEDEANQ